MLELVEEEEIKYIPTGILKHFLAAISLFTYFKQENIKDHISIPIGTLCHFLPRKVPWRTRLMFDEKNPKFIVW